MTTPLANVPRNVTDQKELDPHTELALWILDELDEMNYQPALKKIKRLLQDPNEDVRQAACTAVAHLENGSV